jgi:hypothetical protein
MRDGLCRGTQEGDQALPGILPNQSQTSIFLNRLVDDRVPINLLQDRIQILIQSEKMNQERFVHPFIENKIPFLMKGENSICGLNKVGTHDFREPEELSAFQGITEREKGDPQPAAHSFFSAGGWMIARV